MNKPLIGLASILLVLLLGSCSSHHRSGGGGDTGGDAGSDIGSDNATDSGSDISEAFYEVCEQWVQYIDNYCLDEPLDPVTTCQQAATTADESGCLSVYEAMMSCIGNHQGEWSASCENSFCIAEGGEVWDCVELYCDEHPSECMLPW